MELSLPIATERLSLRRHDQRDRDAFVAMVTDPSFYEHLTVPERQRTPDGAAEVFDLIVRSYDSEEPVWGLTIADRQTDQFIGTVALHPVPFGEALELFFAVIPAHRKQGIAVEAVRAVLDSLPHRDFVARAPIANEASQRVAMAAGMTNDGIERPLGGPERVCFVRPVASP